METELVLSICFFAATTLFALWLTKVPSYNKSMHTRPYLERRAFQEHGFVANSNESKRVRMINLVSQIILRIATVICIVAIARFALTTSCM